MRFPENLKKSGTIGFVAPSFGCTTEPYKSAFANAQKKWKEIQFKFVSNVPFSIYDFTIQSYIGSFVKR